MDTQRDEGLMPISSHLREFRTRGLLAVATVAVTSTLGWFLVPSLISLLASPLGQLVYVAPTEAFAIYLTTAVGIGITIASPVILHQAWAFILPGLMPSEERTLRSYTPLVIALFGLGIAFAYKVMYPAILRILLRASGGGISPLISVRSLMGFIVNLHLVFGLLFEIPVITLLLVRSGAVRLKTILRHRKVIYLMAFVVAAVLTPPDAASQILVAVPIIVLVEIGIFVAGLPYRK